MHHWDNPAKRSSLKWIQYSMDWDNILEMPIHHSSAITTKEEIDTILEYCINDVRSTKEIYDRSKSQIALRKELTKTYVLIYLVLLNQESVKNYLDTTCLKN